MISDANSRQPSTIASVATAIADVFRENAISVGNEFMKMLKILDKIDEMKNQRVIQEAEMIGALVPELLVISRLTLTGTTSP